MANNNKNYKNQKNSKGKKYSKDEERGYKTERAGSKRGGRRSTNNGKNFDSRDNATGGKKYLTAEIAGSENDPKWYTKLPNLFDKATNFTWYNQLGANVPFVENRTNATLGHAGMNKVDGIMSLEVMVGPGTTETVEDPMNLAAISIWEYVRKSLNKPNPDYEAQDLLMYFYGVISIYTMYCNIMRLFGIVAMFDVENLYTPYALAEAGYGINKIEFQNIVKNRANYLLQFDELIYKASWLFLPTNFAIMERHAWLFSNIFKDGGRTKSQFYIHRLRNTYLWNEQKYDTGTALEFIDLGNFGEQTLDNLLNVFSNMIEAMRSSSSVRIMQSDLRKAFETSSSWDLATSDPGYMAPIVQSDEVLMQIENATVVPLKLFDPTTLDVTQSVDDNIIIHVPKFKVPEDQGQQAWVDYVGYVNMLINTNPIINTHLENPSKEDIMVATRDTVTGYLPLDGAYTLEYASDFICGARMFFGIDGMSFVNNETWPFASVVWCGRNDGVDADELGKFLRHYYTFDWAPRLMLAEGDENLNVITWHPYIEWDNYTTIDPVNLTNLNKVATYSLWYSSEIGNWAGATI